MAQAQLTGSPPSGGPVEKRRITLDEYLRLLDDGPYEVIDGELIAMAPQQFKSSRVAHDLFESMYESNKQSKLGRVFMETAYALEIEPTANWLEGSFVPDVSFVTHANLREQYRQFGEEGALQVVPDLVIEVISPTDSYTRVYSTIEKYLRHGIKLVIVADPQRRVIHVHTPQQPDSHVLHDGDTLDGGDVLPGWSITITELFDTSPED